MQVDFTGGSHFSEEATSSGSKKCNLGPKLRFFLRRKKRRQPCFFASCVCNLLATMTSNGRGKTMTWQLRAAVLEWLEIPANFKLITGGTKEGPVVAGKKLKKSDGYASLADFINAKMGFSAAPDLWDQKVAKARYESLLKTYKATREKYQDPGGKKFALTDKEIELGKTIDTKLNELCPYFNRWDSLYGGRQNVCPTDLVEGGLDSDSEEEETQSITNIFPPFQLSNGEDNGMTDDFPSQTVSLSLIDENLQDDCNVERIIPSSTNSSGPKIPRPSTNKKINSTNVLSVNPVLAELAVVVASETGSGEKLTEKKGDFTSTYASAKAKEAEILSINKNRELDIADKRLQLDSERLSLEKHIAESDLEHKKQRLQEETFKDMKLAKESTKKELMLQMLQLGKSADEIEEYLIKLGYNN